MAFLKPHNEIDNLPKNVQLEEVPNIPQAVAEASWIVPLARNHRFTGRESHLARLQGGLFRKDRTVKIAIMGVEGVGKTQLALELVYRTRQQYEKCSIFWIPASNMESVKHAYLRIAQYFKIPGCEEEKADVKSLVHGYLSQESAGQWLLVFDDADMWLSGPRSERQSSPLIEYLPRAKQGCIIFTTRGVGMAVQLAHHNIVAVSEMNEKTATQLLRTHLLNPNLVNNDQGLKVLLTKLTHLPQAIVPAAAYINENGITLSAYQSLLENKEKEALDPLSEKYEDGRRHHDMKSPVFMTWFVSFEQIRHRDPPAAELLSFIACVEPNAVPRLLLPPGLSQKAEEDAIRTLEAYSFISARSADLDLDIHRLVHTATRGWLQNEGLLTQWTQRAIERLEHIFPDNIDRNRDVWRSYLAHALYALRSNVVDKFGSIRISLARKVGLCLYSDGRFDEAEELVVEVMESRRRILGEEHPDTLSSMNNLASIYQGQGRWKEAGELSMKVVKTISRVLGEEHPDALGSMSSLASHQGDQGRWRETEELEVQVLATTLRLLGKEHPETLTSMSNLALTYWNQGRWKESEVLNLQVMEMRMRVLGEAHSDTLTSMNNLALTYQSQGRWKEAEALSVHMMET